MGKCGDFKLWGGNVQFDVRRETSPDTKLPHTHACFPGRHKLAKNLLKEKLKKCDIACKIEHCNIAAILW